ncbi:MAG: hypothetical protein ACFFCP_01555 [Promethearchaeota archaeon]
MKKERIRVFAVALLFCLALSMPCFFVSPAVALEDDAVEDAVSRGIAWLVTQQDETSGYWSGPAPEDARATTAFVLVKLQERALELEKNPFQTDELEPDYYEYASNVIRGWEYLLTPGPGVGLYVWHQWITDPQPYGDADTNGNGYGISVENMVYYTGIFLMALAASGAPDRINDGGLDFDADGTADTLGEIAQDVVDWLAFAQRDNGNQRGAWGYEANEAGDNSVSGYIVLALAAAENFGCDVPIWVRNELNIWIEEIQDPINGDTYDGGSRYSPAWPENPWVNELKTGNLIFQMAFYGDDPTTARFQNAIDYIERHWCDPNLEPGWGFGQPVPAHYQAMYCLMKGFEYNGIDLIDIDGDDIPEHDWYQEFASVLIDQQIQDTADLGHWPDSPCYVWPPDWFGGEWGTHAGEVLSTVWALLVLEKSVPPGPSVVNIDIKPGSWPNPVNLESEGVLTVAICGTSQFDVMTIDPTTITLSIKNELGIAVPIRFSYEDVATPFIGSPGDGHDLESDGYLDLVLHFSTQDVVSSLNLIVYAGQEATLDIKGRFYENDGGGLFVGHDYVIIVGVPLVSEIAVIWETDTSPEPYSGHSRCEVLHAFGKYWLYYDWVPDGGDPENPNVYMRYSSDAITWSDAIPLADDQVPEHTVKVLYCENTIYVTYIKGEAIYYQSSTDGMNYSPPEMMFEVPGAGVHVGDIEIAYGDGVFYVASNLNTPDIWVTTSLDLVTWDGPFLAVGYPFAGAYVSELCWADGKLWLFWDASVSGSPAYPFTAYSSNGILWSDPIPIPPLGPSYLHWGPFSVIWDNGQFLLVSRIAEPISHGSSQPYVTYRWRLYITTSEDGINWTPFRQVTDFCPDGDYGEKGPGIFPIYKGNKSFSYSIIYKKYWFDGPYQLCQAFLNRWKD